jgi:hypothetical protein
MEYARLIIISSSEGDLIQSWLFHDSNILDVGLCKPDVKFEFWNLNLGTLIFSSQNTVFKFMDLIAW